AGGSTPSPRRRGPPPPPGIRAHPPLAPRRVPCPRPRGGRQSGGPGPATPRSRPPEAPQEVGAHPEGGGPDGERGGHGAARREEAPVHDIEVVHLVGPTVLVQGRGPGVPAEAHGAVLVGDPGERDALTEVEATGKKPLVALVAVDPAAGLALHQVLQRL